MSNRTLIELNHDYCPNEESLSEWATAIMNYMRSGDKDNLPKGVDFISMRHHSEPNPVRPPQCTNCGYVNEQQAFVFGACPKCGGRTWTCLAVATTAPFAFNIGLLTHPGEKTVVDER